MSMRLRPTLRSIIPHRSIHTSPALLNDAPKTAADLGFGTANANRVRILPKIDIPISTATIDLGGSSRDSAPREPRESLARPPRPPRYENAPSRPRPPRQDFRRDARQGTRQEAPTPSASSDDFFQGSEMSQMPSRPARVTSANTQPSRRKTFEGISTEDMELPTSPSTPNNTSPRSREASRGAALERFRGPRTAGARPNRAGAPGAGGSGSDIGPRYGPGPSGPRGPGGPGAYGPRQPGAYGARPGGPRPGGPGGKGKGGKKRIKDRGNKGEDPALAARRLAVKEAWHEAPLPLPLPVDLSFKALFGTTPIVNSFATQGPKRKEAWTEGLSQSEVLKAKTSRKFGSYDTVLPSTPFPLNPTTGKSALAMFQWQTSLNPSISTSANDKALREAAAFIQKSVS